MSYRRYSRDLGSSVSIDSHFHYTLVKSIIRLKGFKKKRTIHLILTIVSYSTFREVGFFVLSREKCIRKHVLLVRYKMKESR